MCGITGICGLHQPARPTPELLLSMMASIRHRGPDEAGMYLDDWVGMGHCRLSIIDLACGTQPITNEDQSLWIIYNGEIFNYPELRDRLIQQGHRFKTASDTEVLLHMVEEKGPDCLPDLNGQFAFAVWDCRKKELFLARDRVGIRPLHYTLHEGRLLFASEVKALFQVPGLPRRLDPAVMEQIFTFWAPLPGKTPFADIRELPPGHFLILRDGQIQIKRWWKPPFGSPHEKTHASLSQTVEEMDELLTDAIRIRLRADVPVGCYLSGGLDSSGITAKVVRRFNNKVRTFGIRFEESDYDESGHQKMMVRHLNVDHTELTATNQSIARAFSRVVWHAEKPLLRTAPTPLLLLSQTVRDNGFKVVLTGEGADEFFGGYNIFRETRLRRCWARQPDSTLRPELLQHLYPYIFKNPRLKNSLQDFFSRGLLDTENPFYSHQIRWLNTGKIKSFFSDDLRDRIGPYNALEDLRQTLPPDFDRWDPLSKAQYLEITIFLSDYLLSSQGDRVAMANSLEIRLPYLDYRVMNKTAEFPPRWKIFGLKEKFLLKRLFQDMLPAPVVSRPKNPYRAPIRETLLGRQEYEDLLSPKKIRQFGLFNPDRVEKLIATMNKTQNPNETHNMALTAILSSQILCEQFIENFRPSPPVEPARLLCIDNRKRPE